MARSADERRAALLERITDYVAANGLSDLSLRPLADQILLGREIVQQDARARLDRIGERPQRKSRKTVRGDVIGDPFEQCGAALVRAPCHTATLAHLKQSFQERAGRMYRGRQRRCPRRGGTGWTTRRNTGRRRRRFSGRSTTFRSAGSWRRASSASCI